MSYIGVQPTPVPLQSSQLAENIVMQQLAVSGVARFLGGIGSLSKTDTTVINGALVADQFSSRSGTVSAPSGVDTLLEIVGGSTSAYLITVSVELAGNPNGLASAATETAIINVVRWSAIGNSISSRIATLSDGTLIVISVTRVGSGTNVSVTQTTGSTRNVTYSILRIA